MNNITAEIIRDELLNILAGRLKNTGIEISSLKDDTDLIEANVVDSLAFLDIISSLEQRLHLETDFSKFDDNFSTVSGLVRNIFKTVK